MLRVGTAGFDYNDWYGVVYPPPKKTKAFDPLAYLAEFFDLIEINSSFYGPPRPASVRAWSERVAHNPRFCFTAKLLRVFTHDRILPFDADALRATRGGFDAWMETGKLGAILMQFPWSFKNTEENRDYLGYLIATFKAYPLVLEVRHASWNQPEVYEFLSERNVGIVNIDQPLFANSIKPGAWRTSGVGYIRIHGRNYRDWFRAKATPEQRYNYLYSPDELRPWARSALEIGDKVQEAYVVTNNHYGGKGVVNALQLRALIERRRVEAPEPLLHIREFSEALEDFVTAPGRVPR